MEYYIYTILNWYLYREYGVMIDIRSIFTEDVNMELVSLVFLDI